MTVAPNTILSLIIHGYQGFLDSMLRPRRLHHYQILSVAHVMRLSTANPNNTLQSEEMPYGYNAQVWYKTTDLCSICAWRPENIGIGVEKRFPCHVEGIAGVVASSIPSNLGMVIANCTAKHAINPMTRYICGVLRITRFPDGTWH